MRLVIAILITLVIYLLQRKIFEKKWSDKLSVNVSFKEQYIQKGESGQLVQVINNAKKMPLPVFNVKFVTSRTFLFDGKDNSTVTDYYYRNEAFSVGGRKRITRKLSFVASKRGYFKIDDIDIIARDYFLSRYYVKKYDNKTDIHVFPKKLNDTLIEITFRKMLGDVEIKRSIIEDPYTFRGIRDYSVTDSMNKINWKATARADKLMVNLYGNTAEQKVMIIVNLDILLMEKANELQEFSMDLASTFAKKFLSKNIPVSICVNGGDQVTGNYGRIEAGSSIAHLTTIDRYLARINADKPIDFCDILDREIDVCDNDTTYVVISADTKNEIVERLDNIPNGNVCMIVPGLVNHTYTLGRNYMNLITMSETDK